MNWRLLDIRIGRANRGQFFLLLLWFLSINFLFIQIDIPVLKYIVLPPALYILLLVTIRRVQDMGIKIKNISAMIFATLAFLVTPYLSLLFMKYLKVFDITAYLLYSTIGVIAYAGAAITTFLMLFFLTLYEGTITENDYGKPPKGLDFNTMISNNTGK